MPHGGESKIQEERDKKAMDIREKWLSKNYFLGPNTPATKQGVKMVSKEYHLFFCYYTCIKTLLCKNLTF